MARCMSAPGAKTDASSAGAPAIVELNTPELRAAFAREVADVNRRRLRVIGPLMVLVHVAHAWLFTVAASDKSLTAPMVEALHRFVFVHAAMVVITGALTLLVLRATSAA